MIEALARVALASALAALGGCGKPVLREADASMGDYYTPEEFKRLSKEQREEYCKELADQRETFQTQIAEAEETIRNYEEEAGPTRAEADSLRSLASELEAKVASEREKRGAKTPHEHPGGATPREHPGGAQDGAGRYVVRRGDSLWKISGRSEIYGAPGRWKRIYHANKNRIHDPDRIVPGQEIQIPR